MAFADLLRAAQAGSSDAEEALIEMYAPMLQRLSIVKGRYDEDLYQELSWTLIQCMKRFQI